MVDLGDDTIDVTVDVPAPAVNVQVFGDGSLSEAFGGFVSSLVKGFNSFFRKILAAETTMVALTNITAVLIVLFSLILAYRTIGK